MLLIGILWAVVAIVWLAIAFRYNKLNRLPFSFTIFGAIIVICGSVFGYEFFHIPAPIPITSDRVLSGILVFIFACMLVRQKQRIFSFTAIDISLYGLLAVLLLSAGLTEYGYLNNLPLSRFIFFYFLPACIFFVVRNSSLTSADLKITVALLVMFCAYLSLTAIAETKGVYGLVFPSFIHNSETTEFLGRGRGPFLNPISNGIFLTMGLAAVMMAFFSIRGRLKWIAAALAPIIVVGNISTLTRSVWLSMVVASGIILLVKTNRKQKGALLAVGTIAGVLILTVVGNGLLSFKRDKNVTRTQMRESAELRPIFATIAWEMFKDRPLVGCGFGQYNKYKPAYMKSPNSGLPLAKAKPYLQHNVILSLLTETGLIGTSLLILLLAFSFKVSASVYQHPDVEPWQQAFAMMLVATLISYLINGMFHDVSIIPMAHTLLFYLIAVNLSVHHHLLAAESAVAHQQHSLPAPSNATMPAAT